MKVYSLYRTQKIPLTLEQAWSFFSTPINLEEITPRFLNFRITSEVPEEIYSGLIITYRIAAVAAVPLTWVTEIKHVERLTRFVDEQRIGPFRFWYHEHDFRPVADGIEMTDRVHYVMPWGLLGRLVHTLFIRQRLARIFEFRKDYIDKRFKTQNPEVH